MLDELLVGGEIQESSKKNIIRAVTAQDMLQEVHTLPKTGLNVTSLHPPVQIPLSEEIGHN